jgi:hypothetical protein
VVLGDFAVLIATALITQLLANRPLEKAFATLTTDGAIMSTGGSVATHHTHLNTIIDLRPGLG